MECDKNRYEKYKKLIEKNCEQKHARTSCKKSQEENIRIKRLILCNKNYVRQIHMLSNHKHTHIHNVKNIRSQQQRRRHMYSFYVIELKHYPKQKQAEEAKGKKRTDDNSTHTDFQSKKMHLNVQCRYLQIS